MIPGNHDYEKIFYLGDSLQGWFHNNENVNVNNLAAPRKYYKYEDILLGFTHGDKEKINYLPLIMAQENSINWGATKYREFHLGHIHHKQEIKYKSTHEYSGVIIRYMSSLSGTDAWHFSHGYVGSKRSAECLVWGSGKGLEQQIYYTL
jgi:DNA repair exonuclease SbcCD nuclease subunit